MKVRTPTSSESARRFIRSIDAVSAILGAPIAMELRDPNVFSGDRLGPTAGYCLIASCATFLMVIVFHLGQSAHRHTSAREARSVTAAALAATALTALCAFFINRLDYVPRSLPLIQLLVLCALLLGGRVIATWGRGSAGARFNNYMVETHTLLVNANDCAISYLKMLDAFNVDRTDIVAVLDRNPNLFGRAILGHPIIGPPSAVGRVVAEYQVHGVDIGQALICENRPNVNDSVWREVEECCALAKVKVMYLSDVLGFELGETIEKEYDSEDPQVGSKGYLFVKRAFDISTSIAMAIATLPILALIAVGIIFDLGWPIIFWQKRVGYQGRPFLMFKFRTLHPPYDRQGNFVEESRRTSRFGSLLRRMRLDELPQLWNIINGDMTIVGPRPLLPIDQPGASKLRLSVRPGVTGWAQINGGRHNTPDEKGLLDDWYVRHAGFRLDVWIMLRTVGVMFFGDRKNVSREPELVGHDDRTWSLAISPDMGERSARIRTHGGLSSSLPLGTKRIVEG